MKSDTEKRVVASLEEFADKLERGEPIDVTRMRRCPRCNGNGRIEMLEHCPRCGGAGYLRTKHTMTGEGKNAN